MSMLQCKVQHQLNSNNMCLLRSLSFSNNKDNNFWDVCLTCSVCNTMYILCMITHCDIMTGWVLFSCNFLFVCLFIVYVTFFIFGWLFSSKIEKLSLQAHCPSVQGRREWGVGVVVFTLACLSHLSLSSMHASPLVQDSQPPVLVRGYWCLSQLW